MPDPRIPGPTLMGQVLPGPIRNRVGYGLKKKKKNPKRVWVLLKKPRPDLRPDSYKNPFKNPVPKIAKIQQ